MGEPQHLSLFGSAVPVARPVFGNKETASGTKRRYATYLRPDQIMTIERLALHATERRGRKIYDYEVVQAAIDEYAARHS